MQRTTMKLDEQTVIDILELIEWGVTDYPEPHDDRYNRLIHLANRMEKAKCRMQGVEWNKNMKWK
ncbi:hypothetical protein PQE72_gp059 [Bacillus phage vB_BanS_Skywalker]|uniref:Uncharacterized protein n=2 Tax=Tsamsavirus TaxID=3044849 RepID=A0AAE9CEN5_9CAUD|nr:hypothetical protein PQE72_gp059 [Bacillus phage vB_BanS_Skywalker]YP_010680928.1 hypothetical protein PQE73_gp032 [Bacillus phage vB_BanS_MrDarsey]UGO47864.1 hypothetical protein MRDARSEY_32 [Bacillus phage vB_BanS_MrDarsey]UGO51384.1 hypothetical protein SKYWALKER_227 [Bacillus phage vB_BanS_Skywalker]